jgi:hypothetical protein
MACPKKHSRPLCKATPSPAILNMRQEAGGFSALARKAGKIRRNKPVSGSVAPISSGKGSILRIPAPSQIANPKKPCYSISGSTAHKRRSECPEMNAGRVQQRFVNYHKGLGSHLPPRAPVLHRSIATAFGMSADLVEVETSLTRATERPSDQFVLVQECFRYLDLDRVGTDGVHLSLFEMLTAFTLTQTAEQKQSSRFGHERPGS